MITFRWNFRAFEVTDIPPLEDVVTKITWEFIGLQDELEMKLFGIQELSPPGDDFVEFGDLSEEWAISQIPHEDFEVRVTTMFENFLYEQSKLKSPPFT